MNKQLRKAVIAGNWKMNKTPNEAKALLAEIAPLVKDAGCDVIACVPYVDLDAALAATEGTNIKIGAENCHWASPARLQGKFLPACLRRWAWHMSLLDTANAGSILGKRTLR